MPFGARRSGPAIALSMSATSATVRAMGPGTCRSAHALSVGHAGTRPMAPRTPASVQNARGLARGAAGVAAAGDRQHAARQRYRGAAARAAARLRRIVGIDRAAEDLVEPLRARPA